MPLDAKEKRSFSPVDRGEPTISPVVVQRLIENSDGINLYFPRTKTWNGNKFWVGRLSGPTVSTLLFERSQVNKVALLAVLQNAYHTYGEQGVPFFADWIVGLGRVGEVIDCTDVSGLGIGLGIGLDEYSTPPELIDAKQKALNTLLSAPYESATALSLALKAYDTQLDDAYEAGRKRKKATFHKRGRIEVQGVPREIVEVLYEGIEQKWATAGIDFQDERLSKLNKAW